MISLDNQIAKKIIKKIIGVFNEKNISRMQNGNGNEYALKNKSRANNIIVKS